MSGRHFTIIVIFCLFWGNEIVASTDNKVCFALISDMHVQPDDSMALAGLNACVDQINNSDSVNYVFVAGDMVQHPDAMSMSQCKEALDRLNIPCYTIAGNHDRSYRGNPDTTFLHVFQHDTFCFSDSILTFMGFSMYRQQGKTLPYLLDATRNDVDSMLKNLPCVKPMIVITHEPLVDGDCGNVSTVLKWLIDNHAVLVLSGHYHRYMVYNYKGIPGIVNRALYRTNERVPAYTQYVINEGVVYIYECYVGREPELWLSLPLDFN